MHFGRKNVAMAAGLILIAFVLLAIARRIAASGIVAAHSQLTLPADGREHRVATLQARAPRGLGWLRPALHPGQVRVVGATAGALRLDDNAGGTAIYLRTPVSPGHLRLLVQARGRLLALPLTLTPVETDSFGDGTPDWMRLHTAHDREAFRRWFITLAEQVADTPTAKLPAEITDCASLLRYSSRESLRVHDDRWYAQFPPEQMPALASVSQWTYPNTPLGTGLFRTRPGPYTPADATNGAFAQFADAKTLVADNVTLLGRSLSAARPGDMIFYRLLEQNSQYHSMIITGERSEWVVYHTGPIGKGPGEMRRVLLTDLLHHPDPRWRPEPGNPNFLGVFRWNILREQ